MFLFSPNAARVIDTLTRAMVTLINVTYSVPRWISRQMLYCYAWAWKYRYSVRKKHAVPFVFNTMAVFSLCYERTCANRRWKWLPGWSFFPSLLFVGLIYALWAPLEWEEAEIGVKFCWMEQGPTGSPNTHKRALKVQRLYSQL